MDAISRISHLHGSHIESGMTNWSQDKARNKPRSRLVIVAAIRLGTVMFRYHVSRYYGFVPGIRYNAQWPVFPRYSGQRVRAPA